MHERRCRHKNKRVLRGDEPEASHQNAPSLEESETILQLDGCEGASFREEVGSVQHDKVTEVAELICDMCMHGFSKQMKDLLEVLHSPELDMTVLKQVLPSLQACKRVASDSRNRDMGKEGFQLMTVHCRNSGR